MYNFNKNKKKCKRMFKKTKRYKKLIYIHTLYIGLDNILAPAIVTHFEKSPC
jgi:hypothetical protein